MCRHIPCGFCCGVLSPRALGFFLATPGEETKVREARSQVGSRISRRLPAKRSQRLIGPDWVIREIDSAGESEGLVGHFQVAIRVKSSSMAFPRFRNHFVSRLTCWANAETADP